MTVKMDSRQTMKMGKVTVIGKIDIISYVLCITCTKLTVKQFFLADNLQGGLSMI
jgi:hypothetical protein